MEQAKRTLAQILPLPRARAYWSSAVERQRRGDTTGAITLYSCHLAEQPYDVAGWIALAAAQRREGAFDAAMASLQRALRLAPQDAVVWSNLGDAWMDLGQTEQALRAHRKAVVLSPLRIDLALHCAVALCELQHFEEAQARIDDCLDREPGRADLRHARALVCLHTGRWREAWPDCEARLLLPGSEGLSHPSPRWAGERIGGKRVLLVAGTDAGETLWAARFITLLARRGADLSLAVERALHPLLAALPVRLLAPDDPRVADVHYDFHSPLPHLPWLVDPRGATIPEPTRLACPVEDAVAAREDEPPAANPLRVGIAWTPAAIRAAAVKAMPGPERFADLAVLPGVQLVTLQPADTTSVCGLAAGAAGATHVACGLDHSTLAARIATLDVVVTANEVVAHMAGSLGKPVLNLLRFTPHWIWGVRGEATPWYPTMRLLRQRRPGDWDAVFDEMHALVRGWARVRLRETRRAASARAKEARGSWF